MQRPSRWSRKGTDAPEARAFAAAEPGIAREMRDPGLADGNCDLVSELFEGVMRALGRPAERWVLYGLRDPLVDARGEAVDHDLVWHVVVRCGDRFFDWSARQFDPSAPVPTLLTREEIERDWVSAMPHADFPAWEEAQAAAPDSRPLAP